MKSKKINEITYATPQCLDIKLNSVEEGAMLRGEIIKREQIDFYTPLSSS